VPEQHSLYAADKDGFEIRVVATKALCERGQDILSSSLQMMNSSLNAIDKLQLSPSSRSSSPCPDDEQNQFWAQKKGTTYIVPLIQESVLCLSKHNTLAAELAIVEIMIKATSSE